MKQPIGLLSTDWHLKSSNIEEIIDLIIQQCKLANELNIKNLYILGDIFDSRVSQRQEVLTAFNKIHETIQTYGLMAYIIPGNHDKTLYESDRSFLDSFVYHPNFRIIKKMGGVPVKGKDMMIHMLPFYSDEKWIKSFNELLEYIDGDFKTKRILLSHIAVTGSVNNDKSKVESSIKPSMFKNFELVLLGHYHDYQKIGKNIYHTPSIQQNNFGENDNKGFTILYDDATIEIVNAKFKKFIKIPIDLDSTTNKQIDELLKKWGENENNIRFEFTGNDQKIKAISKERFIAQGIDVKKKSKDIEISIEEEGSQEIVQFNKTSILKEFKSFCKKEERNFEKGKKYLE